MSTFTPDRPCGLTTPVTIIILQYTKPKLNRNSRQFPPKWECCSKGVVNFTQQRQHRTPRTKPKHSKRNLGGRQPHHGHAVYNEDKPSDVSAPVTYALHVAEVVERAAVLPSAERHEGFVCEARGTWRAVRALSNPA